MIHYYNKAQHVCPLSTQFLLCHLLDRSAHDGAYAYHVLYCIQAFLDLARCAKAVALMATRKHQSPGQ
jgi:hypothetical protein